MHVSSFRACSLLSRMKKAVLPFLIIVSCGGFVARPAWAQELPGLTPIQPATTALETAPKDVLSGAIESQAVVQLPASVYPKARPEDDAGRVPLDLPISRMTLVLRRSPAQQAALDALVAGQQNPKSAEYRKWLTPEEFGSQFGLSQNDLNKIAAWLKQSGLVINEVPKGRWTIVFSGNARQVEAAFHTEIHYYNIDGTRHRANSTPLQIPRALSVAVEGVLGIHDFQPAPVARTLSAPYFANGSTGPHYLFPSDYAAIYDLNPLYSNGINGSGQTIAIVGDCNIDTSVVQTFRTLTGLPSNNTSVIVVGEAPPACTGNPLGEPYLDVEWSGAVAPNASIVLVVGTNIGDAANYIVDNNLAPVMSTSFGYCEAQGVGGENQYWANLWEQASSSGITSLVSAGDSGAAACDQPSSSVAKYGLGVNGICSTPYDICVGGTEFNDVSNPAQFWSTQGFALGYIPEEAWNESGTNGGSDLWATGGGYSTIYPITAAPWQTGNSSAWRGVPDVSLTAASHDGYFFCENSGCNLSMFFIESGTSASSPSFAGMMALVVEYTGNRQGAAHPLLYALASRADIFHDIVLGNNSVPGQAGYSAAIGWDPVTGLGSVDANSMVTNWGLTSTDSPSAFLSSSSIAFGNQLVGSMSPSQTVTLTNNGNAPLNISAISVQGTNSGDFPATTTCQHPGTLAAGQNCVLTVTFEPSAAGIRTASIAISDNAPESPQTIAVSGNGTSSSVAPPTVLQVLTSSASGLSNGACSTPPQVTSFSAASPSVWIYFNLNGVNIGDSGAIEFIQPNGVVYKTLTLTSNLSGNVCFNAAIDIAGYPPASDPGTWTIQTFWNQATTPLFSVNFIIGSPTAGPPTGVLPQFAVGGAFVTDFYVIDSGSALGSFSISFFADNGSPSAVPYSSAPVTILSGTAPAGGAKFYEVGTPQGAAESGSAVISAAPSTTIQALFRRQGSDGSYYEAAIPAATGSSQVLLPFDATTFSGNGAQIYTGLAIANLDASNSANLSCTARDSAGKVIPDAISAPVLNPLGHWANYLFPALNGLRGTLDCTSNTPIGAIGIRALGTNALSSLPVITLPLSASSGTKVLPQFAVGASFVTDFYVVNSGSSDANFSLRFYDDQGNPVALPFANGLGSLSTLSGSVPAGGAGFYEAGTPQGAAQSGSAVITSDPAITIQALFRRQAGGSYYEAAVPATAGSNEILVPFDATTFSGNGDQIYTGLAIANLDSSNSANLACTARDSLGNIIPGAISAPALNPLGHWAAYLFPALTGLRGTLNCTSNTTIGAIGIRALGTNAISSLPVVSLSN
jgi:pseudomonalisin